MNTLTSPYQNERRVRIPRPHKLQLQVLKEAKRFNVLCCGRRWGKTVIGIDRIVRPALAGKKVAWFAPTYKYLADAWRLLLETFKPMIAEQNLADHWLKLHGGGLLECWSLDKKDAGRGRAYHRIVVDEAALIMDFQHAWEEGLRPMLADYQGDAWFLSTPKGIANYFHTLYQRGQDPDSAEWASWQMPTSTNPYIVGAEIEAARGDLTDLAFAQEFLAQFVTWAGQVFRRIIDCVGQPDTDQAAMIGVDWGRVGDYTVFTAISHAGKVIAIDRFRGIEYALQCDRLKTFWRAHGSRAQIIAEYNSMGGPLVEQLAREGCPIIPFMTTQGTKAAAIQALALAFERANITIPNDPVLIGELQAYEGKPTPTGLMKYSAPAGLHDDCVMSLAMAWAGLLRPEERRQFIDVETGDVSDDFRPYQISAI